jgi:hypothetical protein
MAYLTTFGPANAQDSQTDTSKAQTIKVMTQADNAELYEPVGLHALMGALKENGCLAIWSVNGDARFERVLKREQLSFRLCRVPAFKSAKSSSRTIWLIAKDRQWLPQID